jgi:hypothetical protein
MFSKFDCQEFCPALLLKSSAERKSNQIQMDCKTLVINTLIRKATGKKQRGQKSVGVRPTHLTN